ncbi:MAG: ECF transporter S component [Clostridia bacterium]|nr:ECF transporter S component [Clostridia bacterium]
MEKKRFFSAKNIAYLAVLTALVVVLQAVGGAITIGTVQLNFTLIPIVLGAILLGPLAGGFLGLACGIVVLIQVIIGGGFYAIIWTYSPVVTTFTCILKTTAAGVAAGFLYRLIAKKNRYVAVFVASGIVPVINTALFILGCLCMNSAVTAFRDILVNDAGLAEYAGMNVFVFIVLVLVTFNFFIEFALNLVLAPAICRIESVVRKQLGLRKTKKEEPEQPQQETAETAQEEGIPQEEDTPKTE